MITVVCSIFLLGLCGKFLFDIPLAARTMQIIGLIVASICVWKYGKIGKTKQKQTDQLSAGVLMAFLAYLNFLWFFGRVGIDASGSSAAGIVYARASSLAVLTLLLCLNANLLQLSLKRPVTNNRMLFKKGVLKAVVLSTIVMWLLVYTPIVQNLFQLSPLSFADWCSAMCMATVFVVVTETSRHMSLHSRKAVHAIHPKLND